VIDHARLGNVPGSTSGIKGEKAKSKEKQKTTSDCIKSIDCHNLLCILEKNHDASKPPWVTIQQKF
jgi:hypothetical protein